MKRGTEAYTAGNYELAILNARGALATNPTHVEATRLLAKTAEALGSPQALQFRRQLEAIKPDDVSNLLAIAEASLKAGDPAAARQALMSVPADGQSSALYHDIAAGIAWAQQDAAAAETHSAEASKLAPTDQGYQIRLATLRLSGKSELRTEALGVLQRLSAEAPTRIQALRVLLRDSMSRGETDRTLELAGTLAAAPEAGFVDKLAQLSVFKMLRGAESASLGAGRRVKEAEYTALLAQHQHDAAADPERLYQMISWMNENHLSFAVQEWIVSLPAEVSSKPPVIVGLADAYSRTSTWGVLKELVEKSTWERFEFLRLAFLSRALDRLGDGGASAVAWKQSIEAAQNTPAFIETLAKEAIKWGWDRKAEDALWMVAAKGNQSRWAIDQLWSFAMRRQDTEALCNVSKLILQAEPKNVAARNNFISLSLLTNRQADSPHHLAEALAKEHPSNPDAAATYGFSLYQQGKPEAAVSVIEALTEAQISQPSIAIYHAIFLAAAGEADRAEKSFEVGRKALLLPEQKALTEVLDLAFRARSLGRAGDTKGAAGAWQRALTSASASSDRLELLGRVAVSSGTANDAAAVIWKLADAGRCPPWAMETLWTAALESSDPSKLYRASKVIAAANPKDFAARNNFATLALLTGNDAESPHQLAEALHQEYPDNAQAAATYGLALFRLGRAEQALKLFRALPPDQLRQPRIALYHALLLAAAGQPEVGKTSLELGSAENLLPDERVIAGILSGAFVWHSLATTTDHAGAREAWSDVLSSAAKHPGMLEVVVRMALKWGRVDEADEAMWMLANESSCPRWVIDRLWADAAKKPDAARLLKASRLLSRADPANLIARNHSIWLSLLTGQDADFPHRQAETLYQNNPGNADVAVTWSLSLLKRDRAKEAAAVLGALPPAQLREPKPSLYYGLILSASGKPEKAAEYLGLGAKAPLLPEEQALLAKLR